MPEPTTDPHDECGHEDMLHRIAEMADSEIGPQFMSDVMFRLSYGRLWEDIRRRWPEQVGALHKAFVEGGECPFPSAGGAP